MSAVPANPGGHDARGEALELVNRAAHTLEDASVLAELFRDTGDKSCSLAVKANYDGLKIVNSELLAGPYVW